MSVCRTLNVRQNERLPLVERRQRKPKMLLSYIKKIVVCLLFKLIVPKNYERIHHNGLG